MLTIRIGRDPKRPPSYKFWWYAGGLMSVLVLWPSHTPDNVASSSTAHTGITGALHAMRPDARVNCAESVPYTHRCVLTYPDHTTEVIYANVDFLTGKVTFEQHP